jgi:hypothetical protein
MSTNFSLEQAQVLYPKIVLKKLVPRLRGQLVFNDLIKEEAAEGILASWYQHKNVGVQATVMAENDVPTSMNVSFKEETIKLKPYGKSAYVSQYLTKHPILFRDQVLTDISQGLADAMALAEEVARLDAIANRTIPPWIGVNSDFEIDLNVGDGSWVGGEPLSIVNDIVDAAEVMKRLAKTSPTDLVVGTRVARQMLKEPEIRQRLFAGPGQIQVIRSGGFEGSQALMGAPGTNSQNDMGSAFLGNLAGVKVWVSNVDKTSDPENVESALVPIVSNDAYLISRTGNPTFAALLSWLGLESWSVPNMRSRTLEFYVRKWFAVVMRRPQNVYIFKNAIKP